MTQSLEIQNTIHFFKLLTFRTAGHFALIKKLHFDYKAAEVIENVPLKEYNTVIWFNGV